MSSTPLFLGANSAERLRRLAQSDSFARRVAEETLSRCADIHRADVLPVVREEGRNVLLPTSRMLADRVHHLGIGMLLEGNPRHARRAVIELTEAASLEDWNPAHFLDTAEMAAAAATGYSWFKPFMSASEAHRVRGAVEQLGLAPGLGAMKSGAFWVDCAHNWNIVCCGSLIIAAVAVADDSSELAEEVLQWAVPALSHGLSSFTGDGAWPEGPAYWEYAVRFALMALQALEEVGLGDVHAAHLPRLAATWRYIHHMTGPSGLVFDFGDSLPQTPRSPVLGWVARRDPTGCAEVLRRRAAPGETHPLDLVFWCNEQHACGAMPLDGVFPDAGVASFRSDPGLDALYVAIRGGENATNHAHLDLGTIVVESGGERFVEDPGRGDYALPGYFDLPARFTIPVVGTAAHNVLRVEGREQSGEARAKLIWSMSSETLSACLLEILDPAHPVRQLRGLAMVNRRSLVLVDEIEYSGNDRFAGPWQWQINTLAEVRKDREATWLRIRDAELQMRIVAPSGVEPAVSQPQAVVGQAFSKPLQQLSIQGLAHEGRATIAVVFSPEAARPEEIAWASTPLEQWKHRSPGT